LKPFVQPLPIPPAYVSNQKAYPGTDYYEIQMAQVSQQVHPDLPATPVWGYGPASAAYGAFGVAWPAATFVHTRHRPAKVKWINNLPGEHLLDAAIDSTILPGEKKVTAVAHVHGGEQASGVSDGHPIEAFAPGSSKTADYPNRQRGATIWYHDHAVGLTRLNVYAGLAGFNIIVDPAEEAAIAANQKSGVPQAPYDMGLAIQDREFNVDGTLWYPTLGVNPKIHPEWRPEFFGSKIVVNGKVWPYLEVEPRRYRFRVLNGSQARFYDIALSNHATFHQIASDGGYLPAPVKMSNVLIAPGERCDLVLDFTGMKPGTTIVMTNTAPGPYPAGNKADPNTTGLIMQFRVATRLNAAIPNKPLPTALAKIPALPSSTSHIPVRPLFLNEVQGTDGPTKVLINDTGFMDKPATEKPRVGATEIWEIANTTADTHPMHLHLVQFRVLSRQKFDGAAYVKIALGTSAPYPSAKKFLKGSLRGPDANERGWKDTVKMNSNEVTRILVRFAPQDAPASVTPGVNAFPFDPTASGPGSPGYVWHCHMLENEENDMMRPLVIQA
ncbi:MAG TPA: multicopper oxidase, partial [Tepidiformaceae bacterium]